MAAALTALLAQPRGSRNVSQSPIMSNKGPGATSANRSHSVNLSGRYHQTHPVQSRGTLDIVENQYPRPVTTASEETIIVKCDLAVDNSVQNFKHTTTSSDWADILCFYTATNGIAPAAPIRASPAPNGKAVAPQQEVPQSVSSTDPKIAAQQASDMRNIVRRKLTGYVGFANLPNQWHRKSVRKGFNFNVMVVGM